MAHKSTGLISLGDIAMAYYPDATEQDLQRWMTILAGEDPDPADCNDARTAAMDAGATGNQPQPMPDFKLTDTFKRLVQDVASGEKSVGDGISEAYQIGVSDATRKE